MTLQLDLFEQSELEVLRSEVSVLRKELANMRRGLFKRYSDLERRVGSLVVDWDRLRSRVYFCEGFSNRNLDTILDQIAVRRTYGFEEPPCLGAHPSDRDLVDFSDLPLFGSIA